MPPVSPVRRGDVDEPDLFAFPRVGHLVRKQTDQTRRLASDPAEPGRSWRTFGDDHRAGYARVVAEGDVPVRDPEPGGGGRDRPPYLQVRPAAWADDHLGVGP